MASTGEPPTSRASTVDVTARHARVAVAVLFLVNGLTMANVVPWFPVIKTDLGLTNTSFGLGLAAAPLGGLLCGVAAGPLAARFGSGRVATRGALLGLLGLPALSLASSWVGFAGSMLLLGSADAVTDAAMNAHALRVQRRYRRSIINNFHALWSLGAVTGGLIGAVAVAAGVARPAHLGVVAVVLAAVVALARRWQLDGPEHAEQVVDGRGLEDGAATGDVPGIGRGIRQALRTSPWLLLGLAALPTMGGAVEDAAASWSAIHLRESVRASAFVAGLGFVAAQALMVVGRLTGDRLVDRFGAARVARSGSLLATVGMLGVVVGPTPAAVVCGFAFAGLGVSTLFPLGLAAAGNVPGVRSADGVAIASWVARLSFLAVPPVVGMVADATSLRWGLGLVLLCTLVAAGLSGLLAERPDAPASGRSPAP